MSAAELLPPPFAPAPGVGARRKSAKSLPKLPLSAFSPPNSGTSDKFPLPPSPSTVHPESIVDAEVADLSAWKKESGEVLGGKIGGVVLSLKGAGSQEVEKLVEQLGTTAQDVPLISLIVPFTFEDGVPAAPPSYLSGSSKIPIALSGTFKTYTAHSVSAISWALSKGYAVDIDIQCDLQSGETGWEALEDFLTKATAELNGSGTIILSNILPPPDDLSIPLVKLLTDSTYRAYQSHTASLSLISNVYMKFLPPQWVTPKDEPPASDEVKLKEWKRRIKMYLGHAVEAFGYQRIIFGSSPSHPSLDAGTWYELARESLAELGVEQDGVDEVFGGNAKKVYGGPSS